MKSVYEFMVCLGFVVGLTWAAPIAQHSSQLEHKLCHKVGLFNSVFFFCHKQYLSMHKILINLTLKRLTI